MHWTEIDDENMEGRDGQQVVLLTRQDGRWWLVINADLHRDRQVSFRLAPSHDELLDAFTAAGFILNDLRAMRRQYIEAASMGAQPQGA